MKQKLFTCSICTATKSELKKFVPEASVNFPAVEIYFCKFEREPSSPPLIIFNCDKMPLLKLPQHSSKLFAFQLMDCANVQPSLS